MIKRIGKNWLGLAGAMLIASLPLPVSALEIIGTIVATGPGGNVSMRILDSASGTSWSSYWGGQIYVDQTGGDYTDDLIANIDNHVISYCLEPKESLSLNTSYTWQVSPVADASTQTGGIGITKSRHIQELLYHVPNSFGPNASNSQALALQIALWEIARETDAGPYALRSGNVEFGSADTEINLAQEWLNLYVNDGVDGPYDEQMLSLTRIGNQDLLVRRVPLPGTLLLLLPLIWLVRRYHR